MVYAEAYFETLFQAQQFETEVQHITQLVCLIRAEHTTTIQENVFCIKEVYDLWF